MKFRLINDQIGPRDVPVGYGRTVADVQPGDVVELFDPALGSDPTYVDAGLFEPVDNEAKHAVKVANEAAAPAEDPVVAAVDQPAGESVMAAILRNEAEQRKAAAKAADAKPAADPPADKTSAATGETDDAKTRKAATK